MQLILCTMIVVVMAVVVVTTGEVVVEATNHARNSDRHDGARNDGTSWQQPRTKMMGKRFTATCDPKMNAKIIGNDGRVLFSAESRQLVRVVFSQE
jgi:hypothetical protein